MRYYGALRVDHVMSLFRQWWVPAGASAVDGGYVHYPLEDLMSVLALESARNRCLAIGEDLGTVPDEVRAAMADFGVYHYKVLLFEKESDGRFRSPDRFARRAIAAATTHDLPTLRGWWEGTDLELRDRLQLYPDEETRQRVHSERSLDRERLGVALADAGLGVALAASTGVPFGAALAAAIQRYLAQSASALVVLQLEDLLGMGEPVNVPGTLAEYPNWQRKLTASLSELFGDETVLDLLRQIRDLRKGAGPQFRVIDAAPEQLAEASRQNCETAARHPVSGGSSGRRVQAARPRRRPDRPSSGPRSARRCRARRVGSGGSRQCSPYRRRAA